MEFKKFSAREIKSHFPITAISMHEPLCQDVLFDLNRNFTEIESFKFSSAFFYDFYKIRTGVNWDHIYVLDGVEFLHRQSQSDKPLVKDRALYSFLYLEENSSSEFALALATNPWLNDLCDRPMRLLSERVVAVRNAIARIGSSIVYSAINKHLDSGYTPRGVWGYDYMFMWKNANIEAGLKITEEISLCTLTDYINSFTEE